MAAGFARAYGSDVLTAESAGLAPAMIVAPKTRQVMLEKNIDLGEDFPKTLDMAALEGVDLIINMSGYPLPLKSDARVEDWNVRDPIGESEEVYREVRDQIEQRVMRLVLELRARKPAAKQGLQDDTRAVDTRRHGGRQ